MFHEKQRRLDTKKNEEFQFGNEIVCAQGTLSGINKFKPKQVGLKFV